MAYYYKTGISNLIDETFDNRLLLHKAKPEASQEPRISFDFSKHVLIEMLDDVTPQKRLWKELGLTRIKNIVHKRMMVDTHRVKCRRAIVICSSAEFAKKTAERLSQSKILERTVCAVVVQELLSDMCLFEKQIANCGDKRSQEQLLYVTDLTKPRQVPDLIQFLKEKFSPFGTILSVLVSLDNDGNAAPESVIKFAYLSEAFAAELAFDQYVFGRERLTVSTHHNIMLSQCDLRLRLREAHWNQINSSNLGYSTSKSYGNHGDPTLHSIASLDTTSVSDGKGSEKDSIKRSVSAENENGKLRKIINANGKERKTISLCSEINDVLENTCQSSLVTCLDTLKECSDETVIFKDDRDNNVNISDVESHLDNDLSSRSKRTIFSASTLPLCSEAWPSKVLSWMASISDASNLCLETNESTLLMNTDQQQTADGLVDEASTTESYRTCGNDVCNSDASKSVDGDSDVPDNNTPLACNISALRNYSKNFKSRSDSTAEVIFDEIENAKPKSITDTPISYAFSGGDTSSLTASQKKKSFFHLSQKLSLKIQRSGSRQQPPKNADVGVETSPSEAVLRKREAPPKPIHELSSNSVFNQTTAILSNSRCISFDQSEMPNDLKDCNETSGKQYAKMEKTKSSRNSSDNLSNSEGLSLIDNLYNRKSVRLASRLTKFQLNGRPSTALVNQHLLEDIENVVPDSIANSDTAGENKITLIQSWLKRELIVATNNRISSSKDNSKKIVCATMHKDLIISVGCSNMTCSFCYPESVNLLLGY